MPAGMVSEGEVDEMISLGQMPRIGSLLDELRQQPSGSGHRAGPAGSGFH